MGDIVSTPIIEEVEQSFLDYALSVITDRAIPEVEDGLKPVARRILYEMSEDGLASNKPYVKCATPVGNTMAKYHPHGDSSIYGALVGISQPWNMRYPLIDFHGNNGSRDGDGPAAYRYTECRLSKLAEATLAGIKKNVVDWKDNYAETEEEPVYLPGHFPNLICNGTAGIAVAMACSFAPHNLREVMDAAILYEKHKDTPEEIILNCIEGPDFPTGGIVINKDELRAAYRTGKGRARIRGEYTIEKTRSGNDILVFTSIPYKVSKETLTTEIDQLCESKELDGIVEIRDESNKKGVRFVIELAKGINGDIIANKLFRLTNLETTYSFNQVALENKTPRLMSFYDLIVSYVKHQEDVFRREKEFDLNKLNDRIHILHGLSKAVENIDEIIALIKKSESAATAKLELMKQYKFSEAQAKAILEMKLSKLAHMEKIAIDEELKDKQEQAEQCLNFLNNPAYAREVIADYFLWFKNTFGDDRRTTITQVNTSPEEKELAEIIPEDCVVVMTKAGNIKRVPASSFRTQRRNGKGIKTQDEITHSVIKTNTIDALMVFTNYGKVYRLSVDDIPVGTNTTRGTAIQTLVPMEANETFVAIASIERSAKDNQYVWFITKNGLIKKTSLNEYSGMKRKTGIIATNLREGDALVKVFIAPDNHIIIFTEKGMSLRLNGKDIGATSRTATGIKGITLKDDDVVSTAVPLELADKQLIIFTNDGAAKKMKISEFTVQNRAGKGLICSKNNKIVDAIVASDEDNILVTGQSSSICIAVKDITLGNRGTVGVKAIKDSNIVAVSKV